MGYQTGLKHHLWVAVDTNVMSVGGALQFLL
jgi:hypothetical protein